MHPRGSTRFNELDVGAGWRYSEAHARASPIMKNPLPDDLFSAAGWLAFASGQAELKLTREPGKQGPALRLDFDFKGGGGFVGVRKEFNLPLPEAYAVSFQVRGAAPRNKLEFKLADPGGKNVWRWQEESFAFRREPRTVFLKSSAMEFAWGPAGGGTLRKLGAMEFVISAGPGGRGRIWLDDFRFVNRTSCKAPVLTSSSIAKGWAADSLLRKTASKGWRSAPGEANPWLQLDFHQPREYGGLVIEWEPRPARRRFAVLASDDARAWRVMHRARGAEGARSFISLPKGESRFLRLAFQGSAAIRRLEVQPFDFSRSLNEFAHAVAARSPRGRFPRYLSREQSYWTCAGVPDGQTCAIINEEGLVEPDKGTFSVEPFLYADGKLITWADARRSVRLEADGLAIPTAQWKRPGLTLETTAFATGHGAHAALFVRYRVRNTGQRSRRARLFVAQRPYQVNPPWQAWQGLGGVSVIQEIQWRHGAVRVNRHRWVVPLSKPVAFGAARFEQGAISDHLAGGRVPNQASARDDLGLASGALRFDLALSAGASREVFVAVPFGAKPRMTARQLRRLAGTDGAARFAEALETMRDWTGKVSFKLPSGVAREAARTFRTAAGQILINRDGAAIQPGPRRYTRSWIRDGVIMGAALLRIGNRRALPEFIRWFAPFQRKDGFVPCCVDRSGPDWLVEHDSHGQLIYGVMESFRFTGDRDFLKAMWPYARQAARFIERLRARRLTPDYRTPETIARYGLLPESASHEGYLAHPVHSYWDDAWALRGLRDAAAAARELGRDRDADHFAEQAESFRENFSASVRAVIAKKKLDYVPGSVEWADFDPTATSNAVTLLQDTTVLPARQLEGMFERFVSDFRRKHFTGELPWNNYTAYEIRIVGALVQLGRRAQALELLEFFLSDRRPRRWNQWPEISWKDPRSPGHLGDVPHTWIAAEYMLAFASLFAYERQDDDALVLGAGLDEQWIAARGGVSVRGLPTWHGALDLTMRRQRNGALFVEVGGSVRLPRGGFVLRPPTRRAIRAMTIGGRAASTFNDREAVIHEQPARVVLSFGKPLA